MRQSQLFSKTIKEVSKDEHSYNAQLLIRAGFIQKEMAGVYVFLPLGLRVLNKIIQIIRDEMNAIGGQEILLSSLQNPEIWKQTNRWDDSVVDNWFKTKLANKTELGLGFTHEEPISKLMSYYVKSYKDLPFYAYQFQTKFRNELRAKAGLLRTREFIMKDLYSFNTSDEQQDAFYELAKQAYLKIFDRLGIGEQTYVTFASGGVFSKYSHEFQTVCENGEDTIYLDEKKGIAINKEVYTDEVISELGLDKATLKEVSAIEVGNIFKLGTKFSEPLGLQFTNEDGQQQSVIMGSYGIGPARAMATVVELCNDEKGIIWPASIAPYDVHLLSLDTEFNDQAQQLKTVLEESGLEVLWDDREVRPGEKFAEADLIGIPVRLVISKKTDGKIEYKSRTEKESELLSQEELIKRLTS